MEGTLLQGYTIYNCTIHRGGAVLPGFRRDGSRRSAHPGDEEEGRGQGSNSALSPLPSPVLASLSPLGSSGSPPGSSVHASTRGAMGRGAHSIPGGSQTQRGAGFCPALSIFCPEGENPPSSWCPHSLMGGTQPQNPESEYNTHSPRV